MEPSRSRTTPVVGSTLTALLEIGSSPKWVSIEGYCQRRRYRNRDGPPVASALRAAFLIRIRVEEQMLIEEFGDAYLEYRKHMRGPSLERLVRRPMRPTFSARRAILRRPRTYKWGVRVQLEGLARLMLG